MNFRCRRSSFWDGVELVGRKDSLEEPGSYVFLSNIVTLLEGFRESMEDNYLYCIC